LHIVEYNGGILGNMSSDGLVLVLVFPLPSRLASVKTSASEQQNSPASYYSTYKSHNNYITTTKSFYYALVEHTDFMQE